jgi:hypothetical protein
MNLGLAKHSAVKNHAAHMKKPTWIQVGFIALTIELYVGLSTTK